MDGSLSKSFRPQNFAAVLSVLDALRLDFGQSAMASSAVLSPRRNRASWSL